MQTFLSLFFWHGLQGKVVSRFKDAKWIVGSAQHTLLIIFKQTDWQNVHWIGLTATTASPMAGYGRGHSFSLKMALVAEF